MQQTVFLLTLFFMLSGSVFSQENAEAKKLQVKHKDLPKTIVQDLSGKKIDISTYGQDDKMTIFTFWATWCAPCKKELRNLADLSEDWESDYNTEIVAVSIDDARNSSKVKSYVNGQAWEFDVLLDNNSDMKRSLNFQTIPYLVVEKGGKIIYAHSGYVEGDEYVLEDFLKEQMD